MKHDLNAWEILSEQFKNEIHFEKVITELFGDNFDAAQVSDGKYLLNSEEFAALSDTLDMEMELRRQALSVIIDSRNKTANFAGLPELRQLLCALFAGETCSIPAIDLHLFTGSTFDGENLSDFILKNSNQTLNLPLPPHAAVCKVNDVLSSQDLQLPCGSWIVIDSENPPAPGELSLSLLSSGSFTLGEPDTTTNFLWSAPVLRLHLIPKVI